MGHALEEEVLKISSIPGSTSPLLCDLKTLIPIKASLVCRDGKWTESCSVGIQEEQ